MIGEVRKSLFETTDYVAERSSPWLPVGNRGDKKTRHEGRCTRRHPLPRSLSRNDQSTWVRHIGVVSGRGVRWGACRHQDGLGPLPQGRGRSLLTRTLPLSAAHLCPRHQDSGRNR